MPASVVFDFDGVIVDTEPLHYESFQVVLVPEGLGYSWETYVDKYIGFDDRDAFREVFREHGLDLEEGRLGELIAAKARIFQERACTKPVEAYPGVVPLLLALSSSMPLGLCSGALRSDIMPILERIGVGAVFDVIVTAEDVCRSKPDPEAYLKALEGLRDVASGGGLSAGDLLAVEDTPAGVAAARAAGMPVLAVTNTHASDALQGAVRIVDTLANVTPADLDDWFGKAS